MDEDTWTELAPWRVTPMFCGSKPVTKKKLNSDADIWEKQRDSRKRTNVTQSAEQGYPKAFKRNVRKIGFRS